ncbi:MAG: T9SS type A sorting domain-containing protein, partial [Bacteroidia bacterium]|nr:T9SS type A sorting domain-containing protein [Bacteroidia bacterium]
DFSSSNLYTYGPAAMFGSFFGGAPVNSQGMNKGYMFWRTDISGLSIVGFRADSGSFANMNVFENPKELLIGTPATYGTTFNNTGRWVLPMNLNSLDVDTLYVNRVTKSLTTDAWGSITTPISTFSNVIRIHEHIIKADSAYATLGTTPLYSMELTRDTLNNYIFMANGIHYPVCIVHADKNNNIKTVEYYNSTFVTIHNQHQELVAKVYPNPFSENSTIELPDKFSNQDVLFNLFDSKGNIIISKQFSGNKIIIQNDSYGDGFYFYSIHNSKGEHINGKLLIIK